MSANVPRVRHAEFGEGDRSHLRRLLEAPALWPFAVLVGEMGLDAAVDACVEREAIPEEYVDLLRQGGWNVYHLPRHESIVAALWAVRFVARQKGKKGREAPAETARALGATHQEGQAALRILESYGLGHETAEGIPRERTAC